MAKANTCQFELTFKCDLHCRHCYTDCYNNPIYQKKELNTGEVKSILDKIHRAGVLWLCFTGGDPLARNDFLDIYFYAKKMGFIITILTNGYNMNSRITGYLKKAPPFSIEITLNASNKGLYEKISQVKDSFEKAMNGIALVLRQGLPLKIKTQITKDNLEDLPGIKRFVEGLGLGLSVTYILYPRLNRDTHPCSLRISPQEVLSLNPKETKTKIGKIKYPQTKKCNNPLFPCAVESADGISIDPYGNAFLCELIRKPKVNLLEADVGSAFDTLSSFLQKRRFVGLSRCQRCTLAWHCWRCPGKAYLEKGSMEAPIEYYCELAKSA